MQVSAPTIDHLQGGLAEDLGEARLGVSHSVGYCAGRFTRIAGSNGWVGSVLDRQLNGLGDLPTPVRVVLAAYALDEPQRQIDRRRDSSPGERSPEKRARGYLSWSTVTPGNRARLGSWLQ